MSRVKSVYASFMQKNVSRVKQLKSHYGDEYVNKIGLPIMEDVNGDPVWLNRADRRRLAKQKRKNG